MRFFELPAFRRQQAAWYARLERSGFTDLERLNGVTRDLSQLSASTFEQAPSTHRHVPLASEASERTLQGEDTATAELWGLARAAVAELPHGYRRRRLLELFAEHGNLARAARLCRTPRETARWAVAKFVRESGLPLPIGNYLSGGRRRTMRKDRDGHDHDSTRHTDRPRAGVRLVPAHLWAQLLRGGRTGPRAAVEDGSPVGVATVEAFHRLRGVGA